MNIHLIGVLLVSVIASSEGWWLHKGKPRHITRYGQRKKVHGDQEASDLITDVDDSLDTEPVFDSIGEGILSAKADMIDQARAVPSKCKPVCPAHNGGKKVDCKGYLKLKKYSAKKRYNLMIGCFQCQKQCNG